MIEWITILVTATCYNPCPLQGWGDGTITADGTKITNPEKQRIIAVSHDLLKVVSLGDTVFVNDKYYIVRDKMNKRWKNRIDILQSKGKPLFKLDNVKLTVKPKYYEVNKEL